jgi:hypothetical protein
MIPRPFALWSVEPPAPAADRRSRARAGRSAGAQVRPSSYPGLMAGTRSTWRQATAAGSGQTAQRPTRAAVTLSTIRSNA